MINVRRLISVVICAVILSGVAYAAENPDFAVQPLVFFVAKVERNAKGVESLPANIEVHITVQGFLAETRVRMDVHNEVIDDLAEGVLDLELPHGSVPTGLKLGISGMMVEGVGVERWLAERAYNAEVGRRVDPALLKHQGENRYRLQVYPIPPGGSRTVEITWIQPLREYAGMLFYDFPFYSEQALDFSNITVKTSTGTPIRFDSNLKESPSSDSDGTTVFNVPPGRYRIASGLGLSIPGADALGRSWYGCWSNAVYSSIRFSESRAIDASVERISLIWDSSLSREFTDHAQEIEFIRTCIEAMQTRTVDLFELKNGVKLIDEFQASSDWNELVEALYDITYDGHSDIQHVANHVARNPSIPTIFVTDLIEYSRGMLPRVPTALAIVLRDDVHRWYSASQQLRGATGGMLWIARGQNDAIGVRRISQFLAERAGGNLESVIDFDARGYVRAIHRLDREANEIGPEGRQYDLIPDFPRYIEGIRIRTEYYPRSFRFRDFTDRAAAWNVVSPFTSLLVLETAEQYFRWGIEPPERVPWDRSTYDELVAKQAGVEEEITQYQISAAKNLESVIQTVDRWLQSDLAKADMTSKYADFPSSGLKASDLPPKSNSVGSYSFGCFPAGTEVWAGTGRNVTIEQVNVGDVVSSLAPETGIFTPGTVTAVHERPYSGDMLKLDLGASQLTVTGNHPILVLAGTDLESRNQPADIPVSEQLRLRTGRWIEARDLRTGDRLLGGNGEASTVRGIRRTIVDGVPVYNLSVHANSTYLTGAAGIAVHNKGSQESASEEGVSAESSDSSGSDDSVGALPGDRVSMDVQQESFFGFSTLPFTSEEEAYRTYLGLRKAHIRSSIFYVEAARWFASHGAYDMALLVLSNLREYYVWGDRHRIQAAMVFESMGRYDIALEQLVSLEESGSYMDLKSLTYLSELFLLAGKPEAGRYLLSKYFPMRSNVPGDSDSSGTASIGGLYLTLYLDYLMLSGGEIPDFSQFGIAELPGRDWDRALRIKALWPGWTELGLLVIEPGGEAVFYDNFKSPSGAFYWTEYYQDAGPDEYLSLYPSDGVYEIYFVNRGGYTPPVDSPSYIPVRVSVLLPRGSTEVRRLELYHVDVPYEAGLYPVGTIAVESDRRAPIARPNRQ